MDQDAAGSGRVKCRRQPPRRAVTALSKSAARPRFRAGAETEPAATAPRDKPPSPGRHQRGQTPARLSPNPGRRTDRWKMERVTGIEPAQPAWKAGTLPLSYTRNPREPNDTRGEAQSPRIIADIPSAPPPVPPKPTSTAPPAGKCRMCTRPVAASRLYPHPPRTRSPARRQRRIDHPDDPQLSVFVADRDGVLNPPGRLGATGSSPATSAIASCSAPWRLRP